MNPFSLALRKLKQFNQYVLLAPELRSYFVDGDYDFLQSYQVFLLSNLADFYGATGWGHAALTKTAKASVKIRFRQIFAFLWSALSYIWLIVSRREILIFGADRDNSSVYYCDFRVSNLYKYLKERNSRFVEFFHTIFDRNFIGRAFSRHRVSLYLEALDSLCKLCEMLKLIEPVKSPAFDIDAGEDTELFKTLIKTYAPYISRTRFKINFLKKLLSLTNIKTAIGSEDMRNYQELYEACRILGITSYAFLGGTISKYYVEYLRHSESVGRVIKPTFLIVESDFWKKELKRWGTIFSPEEIIIGGNIKADHDFLPFKTKVGNDEEVITIIFSYETIASKGEILKYIDKFTSYPQIRVIFKFRPHRDLALQTREYRINNIHRNNLKIINNLDEIDDFDIIVGTYSTYLYEMVGNLKPVVVLKTNLDWGESLTINKLADEISLNEVNLVERLKEIKNTSPEVLLKRRQTLYGDTIPLAKTLDALLTKKPSINR